MTNRPLFKVLCFAALLLVTALHSFASDTTLKYTLDVRATHRGDVYVLKAETLNLEIGIELLKRAANGEKFNISNLDAIKQAVINYILQGPVLEDGKQNFLYTDRYTGKTTNTTLNLSKGSYYLWVHGNGVVAHRYVTLHSNSSVDFDIRNTYAEVVSDPPGVIIYLDKKSTGYTTPATITVPLNKTTRLSVGMDGYYDAWKNVKGIQGNTEKAHFTLRKIEYGTISVSTFPQKANVYIDGTFIGQAPLENIKVEANKQVVVESRHEGYSSIKESIQIEPNMDKKVHQTLLLPKKYTHLGIAHATLINAEDTEFTQPAVGLEYGKYSGGSLFGAYATTSVFSTHLFTLMNKDEIPVLLIPEAPDVLIWDNVAGLGFFPGFQNTSLFLGVGLKLNALIPTGSTEPSPFMNKIGFGYDLRARLAHRLSPKAGFNASIGTDVVIYYALNGNHVMLTNTNIAAGWSF